VVLFSTGLAVRVMMSVFKWSLLNSDIEMIWLVVLIFVLNFALTLVFMLNLMLTLIVSFVVSSFLEVGVLENSVIAMLKVIMMVGS